MLRVGVGAAAGSSTAASTGAAAIAVATGSAAGSAEVVAVGEGLTPQSLTADVTAWIVMAKDIVALQPAANVQVQTQVAVRRMPWSFPTSYPQASVVDLGMHAEVRSDADTIVDTDQISVSRIEERT